MTNEKYFKAQLGFAASADLVEAAITDAGLTVQGTYEVANSLALKNAVLSSLKILLSTPDTVQGTGETENSIKYDRNAILARIKDLEEELLPDFLEPTITAPIVW